MTHADYSIDFDQYIHMVQLDLNLTKTRVWHVHTQHCTFLILHACGHACTRKIDNVETLVQRARVHTRRMHQACVHV